MHSFNLKSWAAWGIGELAEITKLEKIKNGTPLLENIPPMVKRRMPMLAKYIFELNTILDDSLSIKTPKTAIPTVYASKNAELKRTFNIIRSFTGDVSPAQFSMSVHNAIAGLLSVINKDNSVYTVIDSMSGTLEAAVIEAISLLSEYDYVKVIYFDEDLPDELNSSFIGNNKPVAMCLLIEKGQQISLESSANHKNIESNENLIDLVEFFTLKTSSYTTINPRLIWTWHIHA